MYDPQQLLSQIDHNTWWILAGFGVAMTFQWIWLIECVRVAKRDGAYSMPLFCTFYWFAHDTGCVARFHAWFVTYDHWYLKCFWFGLLTAALLELVFFAQVIKYGRHELAGGFSRRAFVVGLMAFQIVASVAWELVKQILDDPHYQASVAPTMVSYVAFGFTLMLRRRSTIGQNTTMWWSFSGMCAFWFVTTGTCFGEGFRSWQYLATGAVTIAGGLAMTYLVSDRSAVFTRRPPRPRTRPAPDRVAVLV
jgi:hypothetical protein